jgi:hypothetical protein
MRTSLALLLLCVGCASPTSPTPAIHLGTISPAASAAVAADPLLPTAYRLPEGSSTYTWSQSQYEARVTIYNGTGQAQSYLLASFESPYANVHPRFLESQILYSYIGVYLHAGETQTVEVDVPEGCDKLFQADVYAGITAADVQSGRVNIHPTASLTREQIADWVATIEPQEAEVAQPVLIAKEHAHV